jgi:hypothetical protein
LDLNELCEAEDEQEAQAVQNKDEDEMATGNIAATVPSTKTETSTPTTVRKIPSASRLQGKRAPRLQINSDNRIPTHSNTRPSPDSVVFGECLDFCKRNLFAEDLVELILNRINSKRSYQLGKQLSLQWSTGAGPRIGCVRDYPSELQFLALEEVSLSPRGTRAMKFMSPRPKCIDTKQHSR